MKALAPGQRRNSPIFMHRIGTVTGMESLAQGRPCVGFSPTVEQQSGKVGVIRLPQMVHPEGRLGHNTAEQGSVSAEAITIHVSLDVHISPATKQPLTDLQFAVINRDV